MIALVVSSGLFILMNFMLTSGQWSINDNRSYSVVDFVRIKLDERVDSRKRTLPKKIKLPAKSPPLQVSKKTVSTTKVRTAKLKFDAPKIGGLKLESGLFLGGFSKGNAGLMSDGEVVPLVRIAPRYPRRAAVKGIEGWVKLKFTITQDGSVSNPQVIEAKPSRTFDRAAINAIRKWKFKPKLVDGKAMSRKAEQVIEFKLSK